MTIFRNLTETDLNRLGRDHKGRDAGKLLRHMLESGSIRYESCFLCEQEGIKHVVAFGPDGNGFILFYILTFDQEPDSETLSGLLRYSADRLKENKAGKIRCHIYSDNRLYGLHKDCLRQAGFQRVQNKRSFVFDLTKGAIRTGSRLTFCTVAETGEKAFIQAIKTVSRGTLDSADACDIMEFGTDTAAKMYFDGLREIDFSPEFWNLGYVDGEFAGLIVVSDFDGSSGGIGYIGVAPEKRGNRYSRDLFFYGLWLLREAGLNEAIADVDIQNAPQLAAVRDVGFTVSCEETVLERGL